MQVAFITTVHLFCLKKALLIQSSDFDSYAKLKIQMYVGLQGLKSVFLFSAILQTIKINYVDNIWSGHVHMQIRVSNTFFSECTMIVHGM